MTMPKTFSHKPKLGDVIYGLPTIRKMGGGILYLNPESKYFRGQEHIWKHRFGQLKTLLEQQEYLEEVKVGEPPKKGYVDLDDYMHTTHLTPHDRTSITENHMIAQELTMNDEDLKPWITCEKTFISKNLVGRSSNHHSTTPNYENLPEDIVFVGTKKEHEEFNREFNKDIPWHETTTIQELASVIMACNNYYGNQSFPLSLAIAMGKKCYVEECGTYPNSAVGNNYEVTC